MIIRNYLLIFRALLCTLCFMLACAANAYDINYSPFQPGKTPKVYPMQRCKVVKTFIDTENDNATRVLLAPKDARVVLVVSRTLEANTISIKNRLTGEQLLKPTKFDGLIMGNYAPEVSTGLLNEDTAMDFVLLTNSGGCGRGGQRFFRLFILSVGNKYKPYSLWTYNAGNKDFVDLNNDGRAEMIHTAFVPTETGNDGRSHNYWVFHQLRFTCAKVVHADCLRSGFPCWILYTFKKNHHPTNQLTSQQKIQAWKAWVGDDICADAVNWQAI